VSTPSEPSAAAANSRAEAQRLPRRMLLVDGSEESRRSTLAFLRRPGSEIQLVENVAAALDRLAQEAFDLALIDVQAPDIDGCEAARRIRAWEAQNARPRVPIIALGPDASPEQRARCLAAGCDARVAKPLDEQTLFDAIRSCTHALEIESVPEIADLLPAYFAHRRADVAALWSAVADANWTLISRLGHDMKGSGKIYGLPRISESGARIEQAGKASDRREAERALSSLECFLARAERTLLEPAASS